MGWIADLLEQIPSAAAYKVRLEKLDSEHKVLQAENRDLKTKLEAANQEIERLKKQAEEKRVGDRSEAETKVLILVGQRGNLNSGQIADALGLNQQTVEFHLEELRRAGLAYASYNMYAPTRWYLEHEGRRYLLERNLLEQGR